MAEIHQLLLEFGKEGALKSPTDRKVVEAAAGYLASEDGDIGFVYSGWAQAALPHRKLADDAHWEVSTDHLSLIVQPGLRRLPEGQVVHVGIPYGSRARLILIYLQSEALRTGNRRVELGRSLRVWLGRMDIPIGGKSMIEVRDQCERDCQLGERVPEWAALYVALGAGQAKKLRSLGPAASNCCEFSLRGSTS